MSQPPFVPLKMKQRTNVVNKKALLFDLDGTLIDSLDDLVSAINQTMTANNLSSLSREAVSRFIGKGSFILVEKALKEVLGKLPAKNVVEQIHRQYLQNMLHTRGRYTRCFDGVHASLDALKNGGFCLALVTNKPRINTLRLIQQLDLDRFFSVIVAGDDTPNPKPAPDILIVAMTQLGLAPQECIMIGDSMNDALAAQNADTACVLLETGYNEGIGIADWAQIHAPKAKVFATLKDAVPFLKKIAR